MLIDTQGNPLDVLVENEGSIIVFRPLTDAGQEWIDNNVEAEGWQFLGNALCVDYRFAADLVSGMQGDGLSVGR